MMARLRPEMNATMKTASRLRPSQSTRLVCLSLVPGWSQSASPAGSMTSTFSQKFMRHPAKWVMAPPTKGPMLKPSIRKPVQAPIARARSDSGASSDTAASVPGTAKAAPKPCSARAPTTTAPSAAMAMINEARANSALPTADDRRAPNWSAASPPRMMNTAEASR